MSIVSMASLRGAPGVTTAALMTSAALPGSVLVEGDLTGGVLAVRYRLGREPGLATFAANPSSGWRAHAQLVGDVAVMVGPDSPEAARSLWSTGGLDLLKGLAGIEVTVVADVGRVDRYPVLLAGTTVLVIVIRPIAEHLIALKHQLSALKGSVWGGRIGVVLSGEGTYQPRDLTGDLDVDFFASLPCDDGTVSALEAGRPPDRLRATKLGAATKSLGKAIRRSLELHLDADGWRT